MNKTKEQEKQDAIRRRNEQKRKEELKQQALKDASQK